MRRVQVVVLLIVLLGLPAAVSVHASGPNQVGLVVQFGDGSVFTGCVEFSEPSISGYEVLARAGLNVVAEFSGLGVAVCKVQNDGCSFPAQTCFCECEGSPCLYWVYHHLVDGAWQYSGFGASSYQVGHGAVEGWAWGQGDPSGGAQPPVLTFEQLCAPPPLATPLPTATAAPTATSTPPPAATSTPAAVVWFRVDQNPIAAGTCTTLRWDVSGVKSAALDGQPVAPSGARQVCPVAPQRYQLLVITLGGTEQRYQIDLGVTGAPPTEVPGSTPVATVTSPPGATVAVPTRTPTGAPETTATVNASLVAATPLPTATPRPPATDEVVVIAAPTLLATATPVEVAALPAEPAVAPAESADETAAVDPTPPYLVFGGLVVALVGVLLFVTWRRRTA